MITGDKRGVGDRIKAKYEKLLSEGKLKEYGMFTQPTRSRLVGILRDWEAGQSDDSQTRAKFWDGMRKMIRVGLFDLELFVGAGGPHVDSVINAESLRPVFDAYLWDQVVEGDEPDSVRAEVAHYLVKVGLSYLMEKGGARGSVRETLEKALVDSFDLAERFKPVSERRVNLRPR